MLRFVLFAALVEAIIKFDVVGFTSQQERVLNQTLTEINRYAEIEIEIGRDSPYKIENKKMSDTVGVTVKSYIDSRLIDMNVYVDIQRIVFSNTLYNVLLHELGHVVGLPHNDVPGSIMNISVPMGKGNKARPMYRVKLSRYDLQTLLC
jgi:hypothetical protein